MNISKISTVAHKSRLLFNENKSKFQMLSINSFPNGSCDWASEFLLQMLMDDGVVTENAWLQSGERNIRGSHFGHTWIIINQLIVDITADQFHYKIRPVIVSEKSLWHKKWNLTFKKSPNVRGVGAIVPAFLSDYIFFRKLHDCI